MPHPTPHLVIESSLGADYIAAMDTQPTRITGRDILIACTAGFIGSLFFLALTQRNPTYDGAAFLAAFDESPRPSLAHHPLFGYLLWGFISVGRVLGVGVILSGQIFAAVFGGLSIALFHLLLRRHGIAQFGAVTYALLLALNMTVLENATSVELYTPALAAIVLSLHALRSVVLSPGARSTLLLLVSCLLVTLLHLGFSLWVFALFVALAITSGDWKNALQWIMRGAMVLAALVLWLFADGHLVGEGLEKQSEFFGAHGQLEDFPSALWYLFVRPLLYFGRYAGLILFPATLGLVILYRERRVEFWLAGLAGVIFWGVFSFWACDFGSFFAPLLPILGLGAAMALEAVLKRWGRQSGACLLSGLFIYAYLFMFLPMHYSDAAEPEALLVILTTAFWIAGCVIAGFAHWISTRSDINPESPVAHPRRLQWAFGASAIVLSLLAYGPRMIELKQPDSATLLLEEFAGFASPRVRLVTHLPKFRPEVQTDRETLSAVEGWDSWEAMARNRKLLTQWVRETAAIPDRKLYLDHRMYQQRDFVFGDATTGNRTEIAMDRLTFTLIKTPSQPFYEVGFADESDREIVGRGLDLFDAESWDGVAVRWTRQAALVKFRPEGRYLRIKYWIGHPDVTPENTVGVRIYLDDALKWETTHIAKDAYTTTIDLGEGAASAHQLRMEFNRTWIAPDGRELGAGLYPLEFSDQP